MAFGFRRIGRRITSVKTIIRLRVVQHALVIVFTHSYVLRQISRWRISYPENTFEGEHKDKAKRGERSEDKENYEKDTWQEQSLNEWVHGACHRVQGQISCVGPGVEATEVHAFKSSR